MKSSLLKQSKKSPPHHSAIQPLKPLQPSQNNATRRVTFQDASQASIYLISNKSISRKSLQNQSPVQNKPYNQSQKLINQIGQLRQNLKQGRNQRKNRLYQMEKQCQKQNDDIFNSTFTQGYCYKDQPEDGTSQFLPPDFYNNKHVIADSFLGSFRAVFALYVELYFQKMTLALQLKKKPLVAFSFLLKNLGYQFQESQTFVEIDDICLAIYRIIKNKNSDYKIIDIKYGLKEKLGEKSLLKANDMAQLFQTVEKHSYLSSPSQITMNMSFEEVLKVFFEVFAQFYDTQIKFKKICKANEKKLMSLLAHLSINNELSVKMLAEFLYFDAQKSKSWLVMRFEEFFQDHFDSKDQAINLLKWLKQKKMIK